jgi:NTE family protein
MGAAPTRKINLALQGGGAHGAFTWGVLDRLLEDERIELDGITGTSAGAMNAAVMAHGMAKAGRDGGRRALAEFWRAIAARPGLTTFGLHLPGAALASYELDHSPAFVLFDLMGRLMTPEQLNPLDVNPIRQILQAQIDFELLRSHAPVKLFICATNVRTCRVRIFRTEELTSEALLASACLPFLFKAIEIDGERYWDGGFVGNPCIFPLYRRTDANDVVIVQVTPIERADPLSTSRDIINRVNEISFNSSFMLEMRSIAFVQRLLAKEHISEVDYQRIHVHVIEAEDKLRELGATSKLNNDWDFLTYLRDLGRATADAWLKANFEALGQRSSVDISARYL